jgi:hypothetical protein
LLLPSAEVRQFPRFYSVDSAVLFAVRGALSEVSLP